MITVLRNRILLLLAAVMLLVFSFYAAIRYISQDQVLTEKLSLVLQKYLISRGLQISIGKVHWSGLDRISGNNITLRDKDNHQIVAKASRMEIHFDIMALLYTNFHPEACLRKVEIINPHFNLSRASDGDWNLTKYFVSAGKKVNFQTMIEVKNAEISFIDAEYGSFQFKGVKGRIDLTNYPLLTWDLSGRSDVSSNANWSSSGKYQTEQSAGVGAFEIEHLAINKLRPIITQINPIKNDLKIHSGLMGIQLKFAWDRQGVWLQQGNASVSEGVISWSKLKEPLVVKELVTEFTPSVLKISKARFIYHRTKIKAFGEINMETNAIKADVSVDQLEIADLVNFVPNFSQVKLLGSADIRLAISETIAKPMIDGEIYINQGRLLVDKTRNIEQISGRMIIRRNNLKIDRLEGTWNHGLVGLTGQINNLLDPNLNLRLYGNELSLQTEEMALLEQMALKTKGKIEFSADITGKIKNVHIGSEIIFEQISYNKITIDNFRLKLDWNSAAESLEIIGLDGDLWDGNITAKGQIIINSEGAKWQISSKIEDLNLNKALANQTPHEVQGRASTNLIFQGQWRHNTQFEPGRIFGIFHGKDLKWQDASIDEINGVFSRIDGTLHIDSIQAKVGNGIIYGNLASNSNEIDLNINGENVTIDRFIPNHKEYPLQGVFNGSLILNGPIQNLTGKLDGAFTDVVWSDKPIGNVSGTINYFNQHLVSEEINVTTAAGDFRISGAVDITKEPVLSMRIFSNDTYLSGFMNWIPLQSDLKVDGHAVVNMEITGVISNPAFNARISLFEPVFGPIQMSEGSLTLEGNWNELSLTNLTLTNQDSTINITGKMDRNHLNFKIQGTALKIETMGLTMGNQAVKGILDFQGKVTGAPKNPILSADIIGQELGWGSLQHQALTAHVRYAENGLEFTNAKLIDDQSSIAFQGRISVKEPYQLNIEAKATSLPLKSLLDNSIQIPAELQIAGSLSSLIKVTGDLKKPEISLTGSLHDGRINTLPVQGEFDLFYANQRTIIKRFLLTQENGTLLANGIWEPGQLFKVEMGLQDLPLELINSLFNSPFTATGLANSYISLEWTKKGVSGDYRIEVGNLVLNGFKSGDMQITGNFTDQGLSISEGILNSGKGTLTCNGYVPWAPEFLNHLKLPIVGEDKFRNLNILSNIRDLPVDLLNPFLPGITITDGVFNGNIHFIGKPLNPQIFGVLNADDIKAKFDGLPLPIENFQASVMLNGNEASIDNAKGIYGKGRFNLSGNADLNGINLKSYRLGISGSRIYYKNQFFDGFGDLNFRLTGVAEKSLLSGEVRVKNSKISVNGLNSKQPIINPKGLPDLEVTIHTGKDVRYRQVGIADVSVNGTVHVRGSILNPAIGGEVTSNSGVITLYGQSFRIYNGKAVFKYSQGYNPYIDIDSRLKTHQTEVILTVKGLIGSDLAINLTSQPFIPQSELYSMLNWSDLYGEKPLNIDDMVVGNMGFVTDSVFGEVFSGIRNALNLDYLYLEPNFQKNDVRINFGDYLTKDFFLSYSRSVTTLPKEIWGLEYQLTPRLSLGGNFSILDGTAWNLLYRFSY